MAGAKKRREEKAADRQVLNILEKESGRGEETSDDSTLWGPSPYRLVYISKQQHYALKPQFQDQV